MHTRRQILKCLAALPVVGPVLPSVASEYPFPQASAEFIELSECVPPCVFEPIDEFTCHVRLENGDWLPMSVGDFTNTLVLEAGATAMVKLTKIAALTPPV